MCKLTIQENTKHMKTRRIMAVVLAALMMLSIIPVAFAEEISSISADAALSVRMDDAWAAIELAEAEALADNLPASDVINAVYTAALNNENVDADSFSDFTADGFFFTVNGMHCAYNYRLRNKIEANVTEEGSVTFNASNGKVVEMRDATSPNVLLVGPYYGGYDPTFTDQYRREAASVAEATGGTLTILAGHDATGPAIAAAFPDKGAVIYDSHGIASGTSTYLCLTTNQGITNEDYANGWAVRSGSEAFIDGRYIENHITSALDNPFVWMAICEGMKLSGRGTTGYALLRAGCGAVYGYSQSVTFVGDYKFEETFWNVIKEEGTIAEAYATMVDVWGPVDPYGNAWPIVMSPVDDFPANPDQAQTVYCDWTLFGESEEPIALEGYTLSANEANIAVGETVTVKFNREPEDANLYEIIWTSSDENVAVVDGNKRRVKITGSGSGTATVTGTVMVNGSVYGTAVIAVSVTGDESLAAALNVEGGNLWFGTSTEYPFTAVDDGTRVFARSGNKRVVNSKSQLMLTIAMQSGDTMAFDYICSSQTDRDFFNFYVNKQVELRKSGVTEPDWQRYTFTAPEDGVYYFVWEYTKDSGGSQGEDCVCIDSVAFTGTTPSTPEPTPEPPVEEHDGDINGDGNTNTADAVFAMRYALGLIELTETQLIHGDVNEDGVVNIVDAIGIMRIAMGLN